MVWDLSLEVCAKGPPAPGWVKAGSNRPRYAVVLTERTKGLQEMARMYTLSYDLIAPGRNYDTLIAELKRLGAVRVLLSQWVLYSKLSASQLRDHVRTFTDANDRLLVVEICGDWASFNALVKINEFQPAYQYR